MASNLLIVESPAKAKTIEKYLGSDFIVKSSYGHIRDLDKDRSSIDIEHGYAPKYSISPEKHKVVKELKDWVKKVDTVWLATDEDREGEAISWHLAQTLGLDVKTTKRIVFHEITKPALQKAIQNPRLIDLDLVDAQQARRILDRLVGFELSELLWKKIKGQLSAGRVQSVAVRLVAERERQIQEFEASNFFQIKAQFFVESKSGRQAILQAKRAQRFESLVEAEAYLKACQSAEFAVAGIQVKPGIRRPAAPFTTSTLQQEASRKMGFSVSRTMSVAQRLYEAGHITYMRTDSTSLSETALKAMASIIENNYGKEYLHTRQYKSKSANAQEAHEAIRPTYFENMSISGQNDEQRLYELIWKRSVASQMADAQLEKTQVDISISTLADEKLLAEGEVLIFDGFLKLYLESADDEDEDEEKSSILPPLKLDQELPLKQLSAWERFTRAAPRYTEASLVKKLEELSIGRPSTYAPTISKIMDPKRGYVTKESRPGTERPYRILSFEPGKSITMQRKTELAGVEKNKLFASDLGLLVTDFLQKHFGPIMDYGFTANIEGKLDAIAEGKANWVDTLDRVYKPFHKLVVETLEEADRVTGERILGKDPESGRTVLVRMSRYGAVAQIGAPEELAEGEKPRYANLRREHSMETVELDEVLQLFQLPKLLGEYEGEELSVGEGRYGPYVKWGSNYISLGRDRDPLEVETEEAIELVRQKQAADAPIGHYKEKPITKGKGRFGPFVKWNNTYVSITKKSGYSLEDISEEQAIELIQVKMEKEANRYIHQWEEEGITIENGRWGPFIRMGKKNFRLINELGEKMNQEEAEALNLRDVVRIIEEQGGTVKKAAAKKAPAKKAPAKKTTKAGSKKTTKKS